MIQIIKLSSQITHLMDTNISHIRENVIGKLNIMDNTKQHMI